MLGLRSIITENIVGEMARRNRLLPDVKARAQRIAADRGKEDLRNIVRAALQPRRRRVGYVQAKHKIKDPSDPNNFVSLVFNKFKRRSEGRFKNVLAGLLSGTSVRRQDGGFLFIPAKRSTNAKQATENAKKQVAQAEAKGRLAVLPLKAKGSSGPRFMLASIRQRGGSSKKTGEVFKKGDLIPIAFLQREVKHRQRVSKGEQIAFDRRQQAYMKEAFEAEFERLITRQSRRIR